MPGHEHRFLSGYEVMGYDGIMHGVESALRISSASSTACTLDGHADREKSKKIGVSSVKFPTFFCDAATVLTWPTRVCALSTRTPFVHTLTLHACLERSLELQIDILMIKCAHLVLHEDTNTTCLWPVWWIWSPS